MHLKNTWNAWKLGWAELTPRQRIIAVCLLLLYVAMIGLTIATAPYNSSRSIQNDWNALQNLG
jgi:hypothetical protein